MPARLIGAHMPTGKGLGDAVRRGKAIGCTAVQVFTSSPQQWKAKPVEDAQVADFRAALAETGIGEGATVSHDSYLINLCAPDPEKRSMSLAGIKGEIGRCAAYGIPYVVSHVGAHMGQGTDEGLKAAAQSLLEVLAETDPFVTVLMETTAGQGSSLNSRFEEIATLLEHTKRPERLQVCLDTCHIFAAGYDLRTPEAYEATFAEFDRLVGCAAIKIIHCNDSKKPFASRLDRHENLGDGEIGPVCFQCLVNDPRFETTPIVVETPDADTMHEVNVTRLWDWRRV